MKTDLSILMLDKPPVCGAFEYKATNTLRPKQNGRHFPDICIFLNENVWILIKISLKFVPRGQIKIFPALV